MSGIKIACELFNIKNDHYHKIPIIESTHIQNWHVKECVSSNCFNFLHQQYFWKFFILIKTIDNSECHG